MMMIRAAVVFALLLGSAAWADHEVKIEQVDTRFEVTVGGEPFTEYRFDKDRAKPILYPVYAPGQTPMTRRYPIEEAGPGEQKDHPHHESLWFTHGDVNGVDFWALGEGKGRITRISTEVVGDTVHSQLAWVAPGDKVLLTEHRAVRFGATAEARTIDLNIKLTAEKEQVTFGDTKEGSMGIRSHPALRVTGKVATAQALNSEGVTGKDLWGKRAKWVAYWGTVDGKEVGYAIFDHPDNPRHPTWWHARDYGLVAANPFGIHDFEKGKPKGAGDLTLKADESLTLRYRFVFFSGAATAQRIGAWYDAWAGANAAE